jgi:parvulin-like peptidyl-prolyl isomerase
VVAEARKKIEQVLAEAKQGADFSELAKKYSQGPSAPRGGELGFLPRGRLVKPFEDTAFTLKAGEISDIVRTRYGFHIIKIEARREKGVVPEKQAAPSIRNYLSSRKVQEAVQDRVGTLRKKGKVEIYLPS